MQVVIWTPEGPSIYAAEFLAVIFLVCISMYVYVFYGNIIPLIEWNISHHDTRIRFVSVSRKQFDWHFQEDVFDDSYEAS